MGCGLWLIPYGLMAQNLVLVATIGFIHLLGEDFFFNQKYLKDFKSFRLVTAQTNTNHWEPHTTQHCMNSLTYFLHKKEYLSVLRNVSSTLRSTVSSTVSPDFSLSFCSLPSHCISGQGFQDHFSSEGDDEDSLSPRGLLRM